MSRCVISAIVKNYSPWCLKGEYCVGLVKWNQFLQREMNPVALMPTGGIDIYRCDTHIILVSSPSFPLIPSSFSSCRVSPLLSLSPSLSLSLSLSLHSLSLILISHMSFMAECATVFACSFHRDELLPSISSYLLWSSARLDFLSAATPPAH